MFEAFKKIPRLTRDVVITEKIDGTNAQVTIEILSEGEAEGILGSFAEAPFVIFVEGVWYGITAGSRNRYLTLAADNFGFAKWVYENLEDLAGLGEGTHYGEWWGQGIQRGYGLDHKRFSLFNTHRWLNGVDPRPACCHVVPVLDMGEFDTYAVEEVISGLRETGSLAAKGFGNPEGVVIYHTAAGVYFKKTLEKDGPGGKNR